MLIKKNIPFYKIALTLLLSAVLSSRTFGQQFIVVEQGLSSGNYKFKEMSLPCTIGVNAIIPFKTEIYRDSIIAWGHTSVSLAKLFTNARFKRGLFCYGRMKQLIYRPKELYTFLKMVQKLSLE
jgi:hypothetical protein